MIKVEVTKKTFTAKTIEELQRKQLSYVTQGGQMIRTEMVSRAPRDSGNLANSIQTEAFIEDGKPTSETGPTADYSTWVEHGTGVYADDGKGRKTPWFYKDDSGKWHYTKGAPAQPFAEPGFQAAQTRLPALAEKIMSVV